MIGFFEQNNRSINRLDYIPPVKFISNDWKQKQLEDKLENKIVSTKMIEDFSNTETETPIPMPKELQEKILSAVNNKKVNVKNNE